MQKGKTAQQLHTFTDACWEFTHISQLYSLLHLYHLMIYSHYLSPTWWFPPLTSLHMLQLLSAMQQSRKQRSTALLVELTPSLCIHQRVCAMCQHFLWEPLYASHKWSEMLTYISTNYGVLVVLEIDEIYFLFKYELDRNTTHPKFDPTRVWTHDLEIMGKTFHVHDTLCHPSK